jgi:hypothetical protein
LSSDTSRIIAASTLGFFGAAGLKSDKSRSPPKGATSYKNIVDHCCYEWEESRSAVRHDADFRHHASVLMFEYMAVIDEVANLLEWDFNNHSSRFAGPGAPGVYRPIASRSIAFEIRAVRHRHIVEQGVSIENVDGYFLSIGARRRDQAETVETDMGKV